MTTGEFTEHLIRQL